MGTFIPSAKSSLTTSVNPSLYSEATQTGRVGFPTTWLAE